MLTNHRLMLDSHRRPTFLRCCSGSCCCSATALGPASWLSAARAAAAGAFATSFRTRVAAACLAAWGCSWRGHSCRRCGCCGGRLCGLRLLQTLQVCWHSLQHWLRLVVGAPQLDLKPCAQPVPCCHVSRHAQLHVELSWLQLRRCLDRCLLCLQRCCCCGALACYTSRFDRRPWQRSQYANATARHSTAGDDQPPTLMNTHRAARLGVSLSVGRRCPGYTVVSECVLTQNRRPNLGVPLTWPPFVCRSSRSSSLAVLALRSLGCRSLLCLNC